MRKHCGNCANHRKETNQFSEECRKCVSARLENGEMTDPSHWKAKPQTNADRIRAMNDEELSELIVKHHPMHAWNKQVRKIYFGFDDHRKDNPQKAWLEWLQQPAE